MLRKQYTNGVTANSIELEDAIDVREIKNVKLANQVIKVKT